MAQLLKPKKKIRYCQICNTFHDAREECQRGLDFFIEDSESFEDLLSPIETESPIIYHCACECPCEAEVEGYNEQCHDCCCRHR